MSDFEENSNFCFYGKSLDAYDEDAFPKRKPISVEDQIATDSQGRRRFHGAFTGGFSAGFFNTVGSAEGWTPSEFKSSRQEKATKYVQKPQDFMDDEDFGEFGIAPQVVKTTNDFSANPKRKKQVFSDGPIPGVPVLQNILANGHKTIGYILLRNMGIKDKIREQNNVSIEKQYGCDIPTKYEVSDNTNKKINDIPIIYQDYLKKPKDNTFGLGYVGLDKVQFGLHSEVQSSSKFVVTSKSRKTLLTSEAFGVGAFEKDDEDIYFQDDMDRYDFELSPKKGTEKFKNTSKDVIFDLFLHSKVSCFKKDIFSLPQIPCSFIGKHKTRASRFNLAQDELCTKIFDPISRAKYLNIENLSETVSENQDKKEKTEQHKNAILSTNTFHFESDSLYLNDKFVSAASKNENTQIALATVYDPNISDKMQQMKNAVQKNMFGLLTRITSDWYPCSLLCKRFNVQDSFIDQPSEERKRSNIIFTYQKCKTKNKSSSNCLINRDPNELLSQNKEENISIEVSSFTNQDKGNHLNLNETLLPSTESIQDINEKIDIEKKQDLYDAIFFSSNDDSDDQSDSNNKSKYSMSDDDELLPKIKPIKEGILSHLGLRKLSESNSKTSQKSDVCNNSKTETNTNKLVGQPIFLENVYGPKIPENVTNLPEKDVTFSSESEEEWVEKAPKKEKKKHKKEKKRRKNKRQKKY